MLSAMLKCRGAGEPRDEPRREARLRRQAGSQRPQRAPAEGARQAGRVGGLAGLQPIKGHAFEVMLFVDFSCTSMFSAATN